MADEKYEKLVGVLYHRTLAGDVGWEETAREGVFLADLGNYGVEISEGRRGGNPVIRLRILDSDSAVITELDDEDLDGPEAYEVMRETWQRARGQALGVDDVLDEIIEELS